MTATISRLPCGDAPTVRADDIYGDLNDAIAKLGVVRDLLDSTDDALVLDGGTRRGLVVMIQEIAAVAGTACDCLLSDPDPAVSQ